MRCECRCVECLLVHNFYGYFAKVFVGCLWNLTQTAFALTIPSMEQLLCKLARQLDTLDEASLMSLWDKYAALVERFEPTRRWEEAALVLSLIQAKRWKNQLFNQQWAAQARPSEAVPQNAFSIESDSSKSQNIPLHPAQQRGKILRFRPVQGHETP